jgi:hypothetical protein
MYWADPRSGRRRRARAREKVLHALYGLDEALEGAGKDMAHRVRGLWCEARGRLREEAVDDVTLEARVRSALGRVCSHPGALRVSSHAGRVELKGAIQEAEVKPVLARVRGVRGVREIDDALEPYVSVRAW